MNNGTIILTQEELDRLKGVAPRGTVSSQPSIGTVDTSLGGQQSSGLSVIGGGSDGLQYLGGGSDAGTTAVAGANTSIDPNAAARAAAAAANARKVTGLRGDVTNLVNSIRSYFDTRYGLIDNKAAETIGKLDERFATESGDILTQAGEENTAIGSAFGARGTYDSSYRGNSQDTVTQGANRQIRDLGTGLAEDKAAVGGEVDTQKATINATKLGLDEINRRIAEINDPNELQAIKDDLDARLRDTQVGNKQYNTDAQNLGVIASLVPTNPRAQTLKTTLSKVIASSSLSGPMKMAMGARVIQSSGLPQDEQDKLTQALQQDISTNTVA